MKKLILFALLLLPFFAVKAQIKIQVSGMVKDSTDEAVISAAVRLESARDTLNTITNLDGVFVFSNIKASEFVLTITALGYKTIKQRYFNDPKATQITLDPIVMGKDSRVLNEVVVNGTLDVVIKEDTLEYNAGSYKLKENAVAEDLLKKLPRQQLLGQHRECAALRGKGWGKPHSVINYIYNYDISKLVGYHYQVMQEMMDRGYNVSEEWLESNYRGKKLGFTGTYKVDTSKYPEHNKEYMKECIKNLKQKGVDLNEN